VLVRVAAVAVAGPISVGERCFAKQFLCYLANSSNSVGFVLFVLFGKISQIRVTFATIFHNSDKSLITFCAI